MEVRLCLWPCCFRSLYLFIRIFISFDCHFIHLLILIIYIMLIFHFPRCIHSSFLRDCWELSPTCINMRHTLSILCLHPEVILLILNCGVCYRAFTPCSRESKNWIFITLLSLSRCWHIIYWQVIKDISIVWIIAIISLRSLDSLLRGLLLLNLSQISCMFIFH